MKLEYAVFAAVLILAGVMLHYQDSGPKCDGGQIRMRDACFDTP